MAISILRAKLSPPELRQDHLPRPALIQKLDTGQKKKITSLVASAGYGKSSLLAEWVHTLPEHARCVWYSLDAIDQDPVVFISYLIAGLSAHWPGFGAGLEAILNRPVPLNAEQVVISLLSELENTLQNQTLVLILDDYHLLGNPAQIDPIISQFLPRLPATMHLVVASRQAVTFSIARMRAQGQTVEITEDELRFTPEAARQLFEPGTLSTTVQDLIRRTEGWVTGLQLIRQVYLQSKPIELDQILASEKDWTGGIFDYLADEVFERQPEKLQEFLVQSSILSTLVPAECDAIFERGDSAEWLSYLVTNGLYTVFLGSNPETYRYHHLLADFLRHKLARQVEPAQVRAWHSRAAEHYRAAQRWSDAFWHAIQADETLAAVVLLQAAAVMRLNGQNSTLQRWLDQFSADAYRSHPYLYAWQGFIWEDQGQHEKALGAFQQAIAIAEPLKDRRSLYSGWVGLGIVYQRIGELPRSLQAWEKAVEYAEQGGAHPEQATALNGLALIHMYSGQNPQALEINRRCLELAVNLGKPMHALVVQNIGTVCMYMGEFHQALQWYEEALKLRKEANTRPGIANSLTNIGRIQVMIGELDTAYQNIQQAIEIFQKVDSPIGHSYALSNLCELAIAQGHFSQAEELCRQSIAIKEQQHDALGLQFSWALLSDLRRLQGDAEAAERYARQTLESGKATTGVNEQILAQTALALAWLSGGQTAAALELLSRIIADHRTLTNNQHQLTRCLWYLAYAQFQLEQDGRQCLAEALVLAERWDYHFLVYKLAQELPQLIGIAVAENLQPVFVTRILNRLGDQVVPELTRLLGATDPAVQIRAVECLAGLGTEAVWKPLAEAAEKGTQTAVHEKAKTALSRLQYTPPPPLRVTTLGRFTLQVGDREVNPSAWGGNRKAQAVFKILLSRAGQQVLRETIIELLWPETSFDRLDEANHKLSQAIHTVRKVLEPYLPAHYPSRYLLSDNETYCLELPSGSWVDDQALEESLRLAKAAQRRGQRDEMIQHYQAASDLYQGDYLVEEAKLDWPLARQDCLRQLSVEPLEALTRLQLEQDDPQQAAELAQRLLNIDELHEAGYLLLMRAQLALGQLKAALRTYQRYLEKCCQALGFPIDPEIHQLYQWILKELKKKG